MKIKIILALIISTFSFSAFAEVVECYSFNAYPAKAQLFSKHVEEAAGIHSSLGATVGVYNINVGGIGQEIQYCMRWDDLIAWGISKDKIENSSEFQKFSAKVAANPAAEMVSSISGANLDLEAKAILFDKPMAYQVQVWDVPIKNQEEVLKNFLEAEKILESLGAQVEIYQEGAGGNGKYHYVLAYDSWAKLAEGFAKIATSEAWATFSASITPGLATVVSTHNGSSIN